METGAQARPKRERVNSRSADYQRQAATGPTTISPGERRNAMGAADRRDAYGVVGSVRTPPRRPMTREVATVTGSGVVAAPTLPAASETSIRR